MEEKELEVEEKETVKVSNFKRYLICLKKGWLIILIFLIIGSLTGLVIADRTFHKPYEENNYVTLNFKYTSNEGINLDSIKSEENIQRCKNITKSLETGNKVSTYQYVKIKEIKVEKKSGYFTLFANLEAFNVGKNGEYNDSAAKGFLKHLTILPYISDEEIEEYNNSDIKGHQVFDKFDKEFYTNNSLDSEGKLFKYFANPNAIKLNKEAKTRYFLVWILSSFGVALLTSLIFIFIYIDKLDISLVKEYDNNEIFRTPFHKKFWLDSKNTFKDLKKLVLISALLALALVSKFIPIPSGFGDLGLGFGYLFLAIACMVGGPVPALMIGAISDIVGFFIASRSGAFFIGYTFQAMLACFAYGLLFYKSHITFSKVLLSRVFVNFICNVIIGSICRGIVYDLGKEGTITLMLTESLPKNLVYLLPQSLLLFFVIKAVTIPMAQMTIINHDIAKSVSFF